MSGWRASGIEKGAPAIRPAEVIGSWATTHPPGRTAPAIRPSTTAGSTTWSRRNRQKARSTGSGRRRSSPAWVMASTWLWAGRGRGHLVTGARGRCRRRRPGRPGPTISARATDTSPPPAPTSTQRPAGPDAEAVEGGGQRPPVDVVAQASQSPCATHRYRSPAVAHGRPRPVASPDVKVTMMLCDSAQVADGKLYVLGGWLEHDRARPGAVGHRPQDRRRLARGRVRPTTGSSTSRTPTAVRCWCATPDGEHPVEVRGEFTVGRPTGIPEGSPIDVALAVNLGPAAADPGHPVHLADGHRRRVASPTGCWASPPGRRRRPEPPDRPGRRPVHSSVP